MALRRNVATTLRRLWRSSGPSRLRGAGEPSKPYLTYEDEPLGHQGGSGSTRSGVDEAQVQVRGFQGGGTHGAGAG